MAGSVPFAISRLACLLEQLSLSATLFGLSQFNVFQSLLSVRSPRLPSLERLQMLLDMLASQSHVTVSLPRFDDGVDLVRRCCLLDHLCLLLRLLRLDDRLLTRLSAVLRYPIFELQLETTSLSGVFGFR